MEKFDEMNSGAVANEPSDEIIRGVKRFEMQLIRYENNNARLQAENKRLLEDIEAWKRQERTLSNIYAETKDENKRLRAVLKEIKDGEYDCKGRFVGTWSGSQCADIANEALKESE